MALDPLAQVSDVIARLGRTVTPEEEDRIYALIDDASAAVRLYTGRIFGEGPVETKLTLRKGEAVLPDDVSEVLTVQTIEGVDLGYTWDGKRKIYSGQPWQFDIEPFKRETVIVVTATKTDPVSESGLAALRAIVCQMAARAFGRKADDSGLQQESIAGYSYTVGAAAAAGAVGMLPGERMLLDRFRRVGNTAWVSVRL